MGSAVDGLKVDLDRLGDPILELKIDFSWERGLRIMTWAVPNCPYLICFDFLNAFGNCLHSKTARRFIGVFGVIHGWTRT